MDFDCDNMTDDELQELIALLNENIESHNKLVEMTKWFPTPALLRLISLLRRFKEAMEKIPLELWQDLIRFINCNLEAIRDKKKEDILKLLDIIEAYLQIEQADPQIPQSGEQITEMLEHLARVRTSIETGNDQNAIEEIQRLKEKYKLEYAAIWSLIVSIYNLGLLDDLGKAGGDLLKPRIGKFIKDLIERITKKVLAKKLGEKAAAKLIPYVGVILTALEVIAYGGTLGGIASYKEAICKLLCCVLKQLSARGYGWPLTHPFVFVIPKKLVSARFPVWHVRYQNFLRCCYKTEEMDREDCCEWGQRCALPQEDGSTSKHGVITWPPVPAGDAIVDENGTLQYPNTVKESALDQSPCLNPEGGREIVKCYITTRIEVTSMAITQPHEVKHFSVEVINGIKIF